MSSITFLKKISILIIVLLLLHISSYCDSNSSMRRDIKFEQIAGLSQSRVLFIHQDRSGFLWFGTLDGLNRYDGYSFLVYKHQPFEKNTLSDNVVTTILEDSSGIFWFGTDNGGFNRFDQRTETFHEFNHDPGNDNTVSSNGIRTIIEDHDGFLWIGTHGGGLDRYNPETGVFTHYKHDPGDSLSLTDDYVRSLFLDENDILWVLTSDGLDRFNTDRNGFTHFRHYVDDVNAAGGRTLSEFSCMLPDIDNTFWIGSFNNGLFRFDPKHETFSSFGKDPEKDKNIGSNDIRSVFRDRAGTLWIGTISQGLVQYNEDKETFTHFIHNPFDPESISNNNVLAIMEDNSGNLWIGTDGGGINKIRASSGQFTHYYHKPGNPKSLPGNRVAAICVDSDDVLWVGTLEKGLTAINRKQDTYTHYFSKLDTTNFFKVTGSVKALFEDSYGMLWIGTSSNGLFRYDRNTHRYKNFKHNPADHLSLGNNNISVIAEDRDGSIWIGTNYGLNRYNADKDTFKSYIDDPNDQESLCNNYIHSVYITDDNIVWIGTHRGLCRYNRETDSFISYFYDVDNRSGINNNRIWCMYEDKFDNLWIGTGGGGLNLFNRSNHTFTHYTEEHGLSNNVVYGILDDMEGNLWLSTNYGLSRFNPGTATFSTYTTDDGLPCNEYNPGACFKCGNGELFFGCINGLTGFKPENMARNTTIPPIVITSFMKINQVIQHDLNVVNTDGLILDYREHSFSFEFAALDFTSPEKNRYTYILEGVDNDWINSGTVRNAHYTYIKPGRYTFRVKGCNNDGVWNEEGASVDIVINPPFWATLWFRMIVIICSAGIIILFPILRILSINDQKLKLEKLVIERTRNLEHKDKVLQESEEKYRTLFETSRDALGFATPDGEILDVNQAWLDLFGYIREEIIGTNAKFIYCNPDDREQLKSELGKYGFIKDFEITFMKKNGKKINCLMTSNVCRDADGNIMYYQSSVHDMSDYKRLESQLIQAQKMESIGRLAGGIAHDFNNILTAMIMSTELMLKSLSPDDSLYEDVSEIRTGADRAATLTRQLLAFSRRQIIEPRIVNLNDLLTNLDNMIRRLIGEDLKFTIIPEENLWSVNVDPGQVEQVLINLVVNARDAMPDGGKTSLLKPLMSHLKKSTPINILMLFPVIL